MGSKSRERVEIPKQEISDIVDLLVGSLKPNRHGIRKVRVRSVRVGLRNLVHKYEGLAGRHQKVSREIYCVAKEILGDLGFVKDEHSAYGKRFEYYWCCAKR